MYIMIKLLKRVTCLVLVLTTFVSTACSDNKTTKVAKEAPKVAKEAPTAAKETPTVAKEAPTVAKEAPKATKEASKLVKIALAATDQMQFDQKELKVTAGTTVELTLTHTGKLPVTAMGHNFVLLKKGVDVAKFATAASQAKSTEYIAPTQTNDLIAHTKLVGGGSSTTITFKAPEPGTYDYICSFPGHYVMMKGKFIVE